MTTVVLHKDNVEALATCPSSDDVFSGSNSGEVLRWSVKKLLPFATIGKAPGSDRSRVQAMSCSHTGRLALATGWGGKVEIWNVQTQVGFETLIQAAERRVTAVAWSPDGASLATGGGDLDREALPSSSALDDTAPPLKTVVRLWDSGRRVRDFQGLSGTVQALAFSESGGLLAAGGMGPEVLVWRTDTGAEVARLPAPGEVGKIVFVAGQLIICGEAGTRWVDVNTWNLAALQPELALPTQAAWVEELLWVGGSYEQVTFYRLSERQVLTRIPGRAYGITRVGDEIWIALSDILIRTDLSGREVGRVSMKASP